MTELKTILIRPKAHQREGIAFTFTGEELGADGEPTSELVNIDLIVPPLNLNSLRALGTRLQTLTLNDDQGETLVESLMQALARNYRGVPRWLIEQTLDVANMNELTMAFMDVSGMHRKEIEAGKALAAAPIQSTGTQSIAA